MQIIYADADADADADKMCQQQMQQSQQFMNIFMTIMTCKHDQTGGTINTLDSPSRRVILMTRSVRSRKL